MRVRWGIALGTSIYLALRAASQCKTAVLPFMESNCGRCRIPASASKKGPALSRRAFSICMVEMAGFEPDLVCSGVVVCG